MDDCDLEPVYSLAEAVGRFLPGGVWTVSSLRTEFRKAGCPAERALGQRAAERLRGLVAGGGSGWSLTPAPGPRDPYGRRIGRLTVDGVDVARILISEGLARAYDGGWRGGWCQ